MPEIPYLSSSEVFVVRAVITDEGDRLRVGILLTGEDFESGQHTLYPEIGEPIAVLINQDPGTAAYSVELPIVEIHALPV